MHIPVQEPGTGGAGQPVPPLRAFGAVLARGFRVVTGGGVTIIPVILLILLVLYPLLAIIIQSILPNLFAFNSNLTLDFTAIRDVFTQVASYRSIATSTTLGIVTSVLATALGTVLAILARRTNMPGHRILDTIVWLVFFTPTFLLGEAWSILMIRGGTIDHIIHLPDAVITNFFSTNGLILILTLKSFPFAYLAVSAALVWLGSEFEDAARIGGAHAWRAWLEINIPLLLPAMFSGAMIIFAETLSDFGTAATIAQNSHITLITYQIYEAIGTFPVDFPQAAAFSLLLFIAVAVALVGQNSVLRTRSFQVISGRTRPARRLDLGVWRYVALAGVIVLMLLALIIPLAECVLLSFQKAFGNGIVAANLSTINYQRVLAHGSDDVTSLFTTLRLAIATATIVTLLGLPIAFIIRRSTLPGRRLLNFVTLVTISVPGIILASGYIFAWNSPYLENIGIGGRGEPHFYGTIWILLAAYIGGSIPYAIRLNIGGLDQINNNIIEAARVQGAGLFSVLVRVIGPILRSGLVSIWLLVFTGTMFELAASELLYPPGQPTMPVRITAYFGNFRIEQGMALAMLNVGLVALFVIAFRAVPALWQFIAARIQPQGAES